MCVSHYGYEPKYLIRETEERLKGVKFANSMPRRLVPVVPASLAVWLRALADDFRRLAGLNEAQA